MHEGVRPAGPGDAAQCQELFEAARREIERVRGGSALLRADIPAGVQPLVLLGTLDGMTFGFAAGWIDERTDQPVGQLAGVYVEPGARGVGLGSALVEGLVEWFGRSGCAAVDAPALPGDRATKQLFEQSGFRARLLVLHRPLR
jgi:GNAT superfamily N-acetyltransferase